MTICFRSIQLTLATIEKQLDLEILMSSDKYFAWLECSFHGSIDIVRDWNIASSHDASTVLNC
jgi:hypothetical protein